MMVEFSDDSGDEAAKDALDTESLPKDPAARFRALMHRGRVQVQRQRYASAEQAFKEALELRPKQIAAMLGRANALLELDRSGEAEQQVNAALKLSPDNPRAYLLLGDVLWVQRKDQAARDAYRRAMQLDPNGKVGRTARRILDGL